MLELTEKPLEERGEGAQNGLKVVEMEPEPEAGAEAQGQLIPADGGQVPESVTPPSNTDLQVPLKDDPTQSSQSDAHLTTQDMRRAKRIRVKRKETQQNLFLICVIVAMACFTTVCLFSSMRASLPDGCAGRWDLEVVRKT